MDLQFIIEFLENNNLLSTILASIIGAILAFLPARYSATKPMKLEIKKRQFNEVYLPLYRLLHNKDLSYVSVNEETAILIKINSIINKHSELVFPTLPKLVEKVQPDLKEIYNHIDTECSLLKKTLGYPTISFVQTYKRMSSENKTRFWLRMIPLCIAIILVFLYVVKMAIYNPFAALVAFGFWGIFSFLFFYIRAFIKFIIK